MSEISKIEIIDALAEIKSNSTESDTWVFDCDGTLINGDISILTGWYIIHRGLADVDLLPKIWKNSNILHTITLHDFESHLDAYEDFVGGTQRYIWEIKLQSGLDPQLVIDLANESLDYALEKHDVFFPEPLSQLAKDMQKQSWIVSGSSWPTVCAIAERHGYPRDRVLATTLEELDGIYTQNFKDPGIIWEETKSEILKMNGVTEPYFVAGDTIGDWSMMLSAKNYAWCVIWDELRHRGLEFRNHVQAKVLKNNMLPKEPGLYKFSEGKKTWFFEVKAPRS